MPSNRHVLFMDRNGWDITNCLIDFSSAGLPNASNNDKAISILNSFRSMPTQKATLHKHICNAIYRMAKDQMVVEKVGDKIYAAECPVYDKDGNPSDTFVIVQAALDGSYQGSCVQLYPDSPSQFSVLPAPGTSGMRKLPVEVLYAPIIMLTMKLVPALEETLNSAIGIARSYEKPEDLAASIADESIYAFYQICDAVYYAIKNKQLNPDFKGGNVDMLPKTTVTCHSLVGTRIYGAEPRVLYGENGPAKTRPTNPTLKEAKEEFKDWRSSHHWTAADRMFIPSYPDEFPVPPEAMQFARLFVKTHDSKRPMVNFLWRGITSYGKSIGVELIAAMLDMPLLKMTCSSSMETQDFLATFVPDSSSTPAAVCDLPLEDIYEEAECDPESAYFKITGEEKEDATVLDCLTAFMANERVRLTQGSHDDAGRFKLVESNYIKALERGYICEVQEFSRIKDAGVLVGLNEYDRPNALIPLVDGRYARRSPDAMVIYTDNVGYVSCRPVDPSVIRRMSYVIDSYELPKEAVIERVQYNTGFKDSDILDSLYELWSQVAEYCHEHDISEGSISVTELEMCALALMADDMNNLKKHFMSCVVAKATSNIEEQKEIESSVLAVSGLF